MIPESPAFVCCPGCCFNCTHRRSAWGRPYCNARYRTQTEQCPNLWRSFGPRPDDCDRPRTDGSTARMRRNASPCPTYAPAKKPRFACLSLPKLSASACEHLWFRAGVEKLNYVLWCARCGALRKTPTPLAGDSVSSAWRMFREGESLVPIGKEREHGCKTK